MFYNANLYKVGLMNSQRHGGQQSTSVTFSTPEISGAGFNEKFHNVISKHRKKYENYEENYIFLWNDVKILHKERDKYERVFSEMVFIKEENDNSLNKIIYIENLN